MYLSHPIKQMLNLEVIGSIMKIYMYIIFKLSHVHMEEYIFRILFIKVKFI
jgi:hypothetical protein